MHVISRCEGKDALERKQDNKTGDKWDKLCVIATTLLFIKVALILPLLGQESKKEAIRLPFFKRIIGATHFIKRLSSANFDCVGQLFARKSNLLSASHLSLSSY